MERQTVTLVLDSALGEERQTLRVMATLSLGKDGFLLRYSEPGLDGTSTSLEGLPGKLILRRDNGTLLRFVEGETLVCPYVAVGFSCRVTVATLSARYTLSPFSFCADYTLDGLPCRVSGRTV